MPPPGSSNPCSRNTTSSRKPASWPVKERRDDHAHPRRRGSNYSLGSSSHLDMSVAVGVEAVAIKTSRKSSRRHAGSTPPACNRAAVSNYRSFLANAQLGLSNCTITTFKVPVRSVVSPTKHVENSTLPSAREIRRRRRACDHSTSQASERVTIELGVRNESPLRIPLHGPRTLRPLRLRSAVEPKELPVRSYPKLIRSALRCWPMNCRAVFCHAALAMTVKKVNWFLR